MGKSKRNAGDNSFPSSSDNVPCSSRTKPLFKEESTRFKTCGELKRGADKNGNKLNMSLSSGLHHHKYGRPYYMNGRALWVSSHRHHGNQYSRRNSGIHAATSSSLGKFSATRDEKDLVEISSQSGSYAGDPEMETVPCECDSEKVVCGLCTWPSRYDLTVVAVLACGHSFHSYCLEPKTSYENRFDPTCPLCGNV